MNQKSLTPTKKMVFMGLICALAYLFTIVLHIKVSFLTFDLKNTILAIGSLIFGPVCGIVNSLIVSVIEMITISETGIWGCLMNFLSSACYAFTVGIIYKYRRTLSGAIISLVVASVATTAIMIPLNLLITPIYTGFPVQAIQEIIVPLILPFNALKSVLCSTVTLLIYKPVRKAFKGAGLDIADSGTYSFDKKTIIITVCSVIISLICVFIFVYFYNGTFSLYDL